MKVRVALGHHQNGNVDMKRSSFENRLAHFGLELSTASTQTCMDAAARYHDQLPRWEVSDGRHRETVKGFQTLAEVNAYLEECEIMREG